MINVHRDTVEVDMIKPKHSFGKKVFEINEEFIDRVEAKSLYKDKLIHNEKQYNILSFYGGRNR